VVFIKVAENKCLVWFLFIYEQSCILMLLKYRLQWNSLLL